MKTDFERVGIGIDIDNQIFYIQTAEEYRQFGFKKLKNEKKWRVQLGEAYRESPPFIDDVEILGDRASMKLPIPPGFTPFNEYPIEQTCPIVSCMKFNKLEIMVFLFIIEQ